MPTSKQQQAISRLSKLWNIPQEEVVARANSSKQAENGRVRDWYRNAEIKASREAGLPSLYAPKNKTTVIEREQSTPSNRSWEVRGYKPDRAEIEQMVDRYSQFQKRAEVEAKKIIEEQSYSLDEESLNKFKAYMRNQTPPSFDVDYAYSHMQTEQGYNQLSGLMERGAENTSKRAGWTVKDGRVVNEFTESEAELAREGFNAQVARERREAIEFGDYPEGTTFDDLSEKQKIELRDTYQIDELPAKFTGARAIGVATGNYWLTDSQYMETYLEALRESGASPYMISKIEKVVSKFLTPEHEGELREIMESRENFTQISYLYSDKSANTPFHDPQSTRIENVLKQWKKKAKTYGIKVDDE